MAQLVIPDELMAVLPVEFHFEARQMMTQGKDPSPEFVQCLRRHPQAREKLRVAVQQRLAALDNQLDQLHGVVQWLEYYQRALGRLVGDSSDLKHLISAEHWAEFVQWCQTGGDETGLSPDFLRYMKRNRRAKEAQIQVLLDLPTAFMAMRNPWDRLPVEEFSPQWRQYAEDLNAKLHYPGFFGILQAGLLLLRALYQVRAQRQHLVVVTEAELRTLKEKRQAPIQVMMLPRRPTGVILKSWDLDDQPVLLEPMEVVTPEEFKRRFPNAQRAKTTENYDCGVRYFEGDQEVGYDCFACGGVVIGCSEDLSSMQHLELHCHRCGTIIDKGDYIDTYGG